MKWRTSLSIWVCVGFVAVSGQSLRDRAREQGGSATTVIDDDLPIERLAELMTVSDLVLHGRIIEQKARLPSDESYVVTDSVIAPIQIIKQKRPILLARPGAVAQIIVRRPGGELIDDNLHLTTSVNTYPDSELFKTGEEVIVLLEWDDNTGVYRCAGGPFGAFRVQAGQVRPITEEVAKRRGDRPVDVSTFINQLLALR